MLNGDITLEEVQRVIDGVKLNKAAGVDDLPNEVLKTPNMLNNLCCLFQKCCSVWHYTVCVEQIHN